MMRMNPLSFQHVGVAHVSCRLDIRNGSAGGSNLRKPVRLAGMGGMIRWMGSVLALVLMASPAIAGDRAARIVIAGGDLTEIVFALGAGERVVGVDQTSTFPPEAAALPQIGYVRRLAPEGVLSLSPDLMLAADDAGPPVALDRLRAAEVEIAQAPSTETASDVAEKIRFVGETLGLAPEAAEAAAAFETDLAAVQAKVAQLPTRPRALFILSIRGGAPLVGGRATEADEMLTQAGAENVVTGFEGYKPMNREAILASQPDVIVMMAQHAQRSGGIDSILARPDIALTPAGRNKRAVTMDGMLLLGFGPRTPQAIADLAAAMQPEAAAKVGL